MAVVSFAAVIRVVNRHATLLPTKENRLAAASLALALNLKWHCVQFVSWLGKQMGVSTVLSLMTTMLLSKLIALEQTY